MSNQRTAGAKNARIKALEHAPGQHNIGESHFGQHSSPSFTPSAISDEHARNYFHAIHQGFMEHGLDRQGASQAVHRVVRSHLATLKKDPELTNPGKAGEHVTSQFKDHVASIPTKYLSNDQKKGIYGIPTASLVKHYMEGAGKDASISEQLYKKHLGEVAVAANKRAGKPKKASLSNVHDLNRIEDVFAIRKSMDFSSVLEEFSRED